MAGVEIEISLEEQKALQALTKLINKMDETGESAKKNFEGASHSFETFKGVLGAEFAIKGLELAADAAKEFFKILLVDGVKAASEQEKALKRLDTALKLSGNSTEGAKEAFAEFANQLQETTGIQDEVALSSIALLQSLGPLTQRGLKEGTLAAADLSAALGVDLETAIRAVGAASTGNVSLLQRLTKQTFHEGATSAETFKLALDQLNASFGGSAVSNFQTFDGAVTGAKNQFEDFIKSFGRIVIENDAVKAAINSVTAVFKELEKFVDANKESIDEFITGGVDLLADAFTGTIDFVKSFIASFKESGTVLNTIGRVFKTFYDVAVNIGSILVDVVVAAFGLFKQALEATGLSLTKLFGYIKLFEGTLISGMIIPLSLALEGLGALVGIFDKQLGQKIQNAINPLKELGKTLQEEGANQIAASEEIATAKNAEVNTYVAGENKKQAKIKETGALTKAQQEEDVNVFVLYRTALEEQANAFDQIKADREQANADAEFQRLSDNLGRTEALTQLARAKELANAGKEAEAKKVLSEANRKAAEKDLGSLFDFEKNTNAGRAANFKSTLGTIATLQSSGSQELFAIGKAAAIATATIDGIAAVQKALASAPPPFNFALAALVGVASAVNVAKIASAQPPGRAEGGLVPGLSSPTDNTLINAAPGELVINRRQQTDLFNAINSGNLGGGAAGTSVVIQGNVIADDDTQVQKLIKSINDNINFNNARLAT